MWKWLRSIFKSQTFVLKEKLEVLPQIFVFKFIPPNNFTWQAGQFLFYELPHKNPDNRGTIRHFTIASAPNEHLVYLATRIQEDGSSFKKALKDLEPGREIKVGNLGGQFVVKDYQKKLIFIAGGIGITPFRAIILDLADKNKLEDVTLLYANRDQNILFKDEFDKITAQNPGLRIHYVLEPERLDELLLKKFVLTDADYFVSGPPPMVKNVVNLLKKLGTKKITQDSFTGYDNI